VILGSTIKKNARLSRKIQMAKFKCRITKSK
jgi:hypothetical protein